MLGSHGTCLRPRPKRPARRNKPPHTTRGCILPFANADSPGRLFGVLLTVSGSSIRVARYSSVFLRTLLSWRRANTWTKPRTKNSKNNQTIITRSTSGKQQSRETLNKFSDIHRC